MDRSSPLYDPRLSDRERAEYLISQMTLEEKFACFTLRLRNDRLGFAASTCGDRVAGRSRADERVRARGADGNRPI